MKQSAESNIIPLHPKNRTLPFARPDITDEEIEAVVRVLKSGWLTSGPEVEKFESEFAAYTGSRYAVAVNSATAALHLGLENYSIGPKDAVIVPSITFTATAEVAEYNNVLPIIMDVNPASYLLDPQYVEDFIKYECKNTSDGLIHRNSGRRLKAILPVHLGGRLCDMDGFLEISSKYKLKIIEDAAHAFPSSYKGKKIGSIGDITAFSFYATKNLTTGEGGMLTTNSKSTAEKLRRIRLHGIKGQTYGRKRWKYDVVEKGYKYNMTDMAAAMGRIQLRRTEEMLQKRGEIINSYNKELSAVEGLKLPPVPASGESFHLYIIEVLKTKIMTRDIFVEKLFKRGIQTSLHFIPLYRHTYYKKKYKLKYSNFPNSERLFKTIVSLPVYSAMSETDLARVIKNIKDVMKD